MYWFGLGFLLLIAELFSGSFYLLVIAAVFALVGLCEVVFHTGLNANLAIAGFLIMVGAFVVRKINRKRKQKQSTKNDDLDFGQIVDILTSSEDGFAQVFYRGAEWEARITNVTAETTKIKKGKIIAKEGNTLMIELV